MRRPFSDTGAALAAGVLVVTPAAPPPIAVPSEIGLLKLARGEARPLAKAVRFYVVRERAR